MTAVLVTIMGFGCFASGWAVGGSVERFRRKRDWRDMRFRRETAALTLQLAREQRRAAEELHYAECLKHINLAQRCARMIDEDD